MAKRVVSIEQILQGKILDATLVSRSIVVRGLPEGATESVVRAHFELINNVRGPIKHVKIFPEESTSLVVFEDIEGL